MNAISPYDEAIRFLRQHPGTGGAGSLAKLVLSLYNDWCGFSVSECLGNLDERLTSLALRMIRDYAEHGETDDLRAAGKIISDDLYPRLWEMSLAMRDAREATRSRWQAEERKAEMDALHAAEAAMFTDPARLIPVPQAKELLDQSDPLYAHYNAAGDWRYVKLGPDAARAAIEQNGGAELSQNCPESGQMLAVRIDNRIHYLSTDYDAREAYLETIRGSRDSVALRVSVAPRGSQQG